MARIREYGALESLVDYLRFYVEVKASVARAITKLYTVSLRHMVGIVQLVRTPDCGSGGRRFESDYSPQALTCPLMNGKRMSYRLLRCKRFK